MPKDASEVMSDDRSRGILTPDDRKFLKGQKEFSSEQSERDARYRIRNRIINSIYDFTIIRNNLEKSDREQIFSILEAPEGLADSIGDTLSEEALENLLESTIFREGVKHNFSFFYLAIEEADAGFEAMLESAISDVESQRGYVVEDVNINIEIDRKSPDIEELIAKFRRGEQLSRGEISTLMRSGELELSQDTMNDLFKQLTSNLSEELEQKELPFSIEEDEDDSS